MPLAVATALARAHAISEGVLARALHNGLVMRRLLLQSARGFRKAQDEARCCRHFGRAGAALARRRCPLARRVIDRISDTPPLVKRTESDWLSRSHGWCGIYHIGPYPFVL
jgi:hypothetical protein